MMKIEISNDTADELFKDIFIRDYKNVLAYINELQAKTELQNYEMEDLVDNNKWLEAMEALMEYYVGPDWKDRING
jgi:hypothetical protein